ncbi:hypothetical protein GGR10_000587 [Bartonella chomelii]|uniref:Uncharacterized protein n=1 Tax=Bartonella chomelii TaxID=236402 RepID=A0ABR6E2E8_9HYPH|nr:hypothetical protein [Bartonella chomelii]MBA9082746.1 hypothetical protein [Bartonella chomelii]
MESFKVVRGGSIGGGVLVRVGRSMKLALMEARLSCVGGRWGIII